MTYAHSGSGKRGVGLVHSAQPTLPAAAVAKESLHRSGRRDSSGKGVPDEEPSAHDSGGTGGACILDSGDMSIGYLCACRSSEQTSRGGCL